VIPGNQKLQDLVRKHYDAYNEAQTNQRSMIADLILSEIQGLGGRFLRLDDVGIYSIEAREAKKKIMQCFRDTRKARRRPIQTLQQPHAYAHTTHKWSWKKAQLPYTPPKEEGKAIPACTTTATPYIYPPRGAPAPASKEESRQTPSVASAPSEATESEDDGYDDENSEGDTGTGSDDAQFEDATEDDIINHALKRRRSSTTTNSNGREAGGGGKSRHRRALPIGKKPGPAETSAFPSTTTNNTPKNEVTPREHDVLVHNSDEAINHRKYPCEARRVRLGILW
jgi:hypothetical protein